MLVYVIKNNNNIENKKYKRLKVRVEYRKNNNKVSKEILKIDNNKSDYNNKTSKKNISNKNKFNDKHIKIKK